MTSITNQIHSANYSVLLSITNAISLFSDITFKFIHFLTSIDLILNNCIAQTFDSLKATTYNIQHPKSSNFRIFKIVRKIKNFVYRILGAVLKSLLLYPNLNFNMHLRVFVKGLHLH